MRFYKKEYNKGIPLQRIKYPCLVLVPNRWNDHGYRTLFKLWLYRNSVTRIEIGDVKIADRKLGQPEKSEVITEIKDSFIKLPKHQASLGQSVEYYDRIRENFPDDYIELLSALNDLTLSAELRNVFQNLEVFKVSLLRSSEAEKIISDVYRANLENQEFSSSGFNFTYSIQLPNADEHHVVKFNFSDQPDKEFRTVVLIGKNGTGKTQYLSNLANSLGDAEAAGDFIPSRPLFTKVIAISFSLFDRFKIPKTSKLFSYKYVGFRETEEILSDRGRNSRLRMAFSEVKKRNREKEWFSFIDQVIGLKDLEKILGKRIQSSKTIEGDFDAIVKSRTSLLSSGQNILIFIITELIANITKDSIVLYDEPETHLHPNAIAKLIKGLNNILEHYNSFAVIATHSPIVVQETPSRNVRLFDRIGNTPIVKPLPQESYGENLSTITDSIFYLNQVKENYKEYFDEKIKEKSIDEINQEFDNKLSMNALLYLNAIDKKKGRKK